MKIKLEEAWRNCLEWNTKKQFKGEDMMEIGSEEPFCSERGCSEEWRVETTPSQSSRK